MDSDRRRQRWRQVLTQCVHRRPADRVARKAGHRGPRSKPNSHGVSTEPCWRLAVLASLIAPVRSCNPPRNRRSAAGTSYRPSDCWPRPIAWTPACPRHALNHRCLPTGRHARIRHPPLVPRESSSAQPRALATAAPTKGAAMSAAGASIPSAWLNWPPATGGTTHIRQFTVALATVMHKSVALADALLLATRTWQLSPPAVQVPARAAGHFCHS